MRGIHRWPVNSPHKWPVKRKIFPFYDVIMLIDFLHISEHTLQPFWYVDLGSMYLIRHVKIALPSDCCGKLDDLSLLTKTGPKWAPLSTPTVKRLSNFYSRIYTPYSAKMYSVCNCNMISFGFGTNLAISDEVYVLRRSIVSCYLNIVHCWFDSSALRTELTSLCIENIGRDLHPSAE